MSWPATNWAGNVAFRAERVHHPSSIEEIQQLIAGNDRIRALGSGHSFNPVADSNGDLLCLEGLSREVVVSADGTTATVSAGIRYAELCRRLHALGRAVPSLGSLPHISVAGSCATATHGSGDGNGNLATTVSAVDVVRADGELVRLDRTDGRFPGAVVALGALGVVVRLTLDLVPAFDMTQHVYDGLPFDALDDHFEEIFASGYSVSLFTDWREPRFTQMWVKRRTGANEPPPRKWLGATLADEARHPVPGMPARFCTEQLGVPGPWHERLPHFRFEFTPSSGAELQSEYLVPRELAVEALRALDGVRDRVAPVLQVSEVRTVAADELWLSPSYRRPVVGLHFTWVQDAAAVLPVMALVEQRLTPFGPVPHWGKLFTLPPDDVRSSYERLAEFRALAAAMDPGGKFRNAFTDRYVFAD